MRETATDGQKVFQREPKQAASVPSLSDAMVRWDHGAVVWYIPLGLMPMLGQHPAPAPAPAAFAAAAFATGSEP